MTKSFSIAALGIFAVLAMSFVAVTPASAAVNIDTLNGVVFENGSGWTADVAGSAGDTVRAKVNIDVTSDDDFNSLSWDFIGDFLPRVCVDLPEVTQSISNVPVEFDLQLPQNFGTHDLQVRVYGVDGAGKDFNCSDSNVRDTETVNDRVTVGFDNTVSGSIGGSSGSSGSVGSVSYLQALIADLQKQIGCYISGQEYDSTAKQCKAKPAPAKPAYCDQMKNYTVWYGQSGGQVSAYQQFLISNGFSIPAGPTGNYFAQTQAAATAMANACR